MSEDLYNVGLFGTGSLVCRRCGALVCISPEARQVHDDFHAHLAKTAEYLVEIVGRLEALEGNQA